MDNKPESKHKIDLTTNFCMAKAMLEDYARVISKIEGVAEIDVIQRVRMRTKELLLELNSTNNIAEPKSLHQTHKMSNFDKHGPSLFDNHNEDPDINGN